MEADRSERTVETKHAEMNITLGITLTDYNYAATYGDYYVTDCTLCKTIEQKNTISH